MSGLNTRTKKRQQESGLQQITILILQFFNAAELSQQSTELSQQSTVQLESTLESLLLNNTKLISIFVIQRDVH